MRFIVILCSGDGGIVIYVYIIILFDYLGEAENDGEVEVG